MLSNFPIDKSQPTTRDIREANRLQILHQLLLRKTSTRQELTKLTGSEQRDSRPISLPVCWKKGWLWKLALPPPKVDAQRQFLPFKRICRRLCRGGCG